MYSPTSFTFYKTPLSDEPEDFQYMLDGFIYKKPN
jgi:hypothetical protein